jgi:hypothetical protein
MSMSVSTPTLALPLHGGGNYTPSPYQGEGWDGGEISSKVNKLDVSNAP